MILIILILHFLIKNYMLDSRPQVVERSERLDEPAAVAKEITTTKTSTPEADIKIESSADTHQDSQIVTINKPQQAVDDDELLHYVQSLGKDRECGEVKWKDPVATTNLKKPVAVDPSAKDTSYYMLNEYEDENVMNGGHIFENIDGWEHDASGFASFEKLTNGM